MVFTDGLPFPIIFGVYKEKTKVRSTGTFLSPILGGSASLIWMHIDSAYEKVQC